MPTVGPDQRIDILLYLDDSEQPYRQLRLWLDVVAPTEAAVATIPTNLLPSARGPVRTETSPGARPVRPDVPIVTEEAPPALGVVEFAPSVAVGEGVAPSVASEPPVEAAATAQPAATAAGVQTGDGAAPAMPPVAATDAPVAAPGPTAAHAPVDASALPPSAEVPDSEPAPTPVSEALPAPSPRAFTPFWVKNHRWAVLWSGPADDRGAVAFGVTSSQFCSFLVVLPQDSGRVFVFNPFSANYAWIDAVDLGPVEMPAVRSSARRITQNCDGDIPQ
jgi:hypothetical protein